MLSVFNRRLWRFEAILFMIGLLFLYIIMPVHALNCNDQDCWDDGNLLSEQDKICNALPHPYLAGYYSEDGSEMYASGKTEITKDDTTAQATPSPRTIRLQEST